MARRRFAFMSLRSQTLISSSLLAGLHFALGEGVVSCQQAFGLVTYKKLGAWLVADGARCAVGLGLALFFAHCDSH